MKTELRILTNVCEEAVKSAKYFLDDNGSEFEPEDFDAYLDSTFAEYDFPESVKDFFTQVSILAINTFGEIND